MKCSVVIACYNNPDLIIGTLQSVERQTYDNWEVVLVEDSSTDNTLEVLQQFVISSAFKARYKLIPLPKNGGVSHAKGMGVRNSSGEIIVILDHDDQLAPNALEEIVPIHQLYPEASIVYTQHYNCDHLLNPLEIAPESAQVVYSDILEEKIGHLLTYKRRHYDLTPGYDLFFKVSDDKDIIYKLEEVGDTIFVEKPLYYFRISHRGASRGFEGFNKSRDEKLVAAQNAMARRDKSGVKQISQRDYINFLAEHYLLQAEGYILMKKPLGKPFIYSLFKSFFYRPTKNIKRKLRATLLLSIIKRLIFGSKTTI
ncbi:glycosyltransferase family 2 protein [Pontibacter sp. HSC-36F09]|uniref:glycosyltransferase family 2 protein n=1 Tax=Pontibacter sp. HSC-36F09 TaxID=2910966 RepID=UPI0020A032E5|nr:glycosyltransferase family 2 protein [Pontibacter sp. HSC-36F09]MCP2043695.1 glycosyltransferase involved in cell wall biosynthesis [Pontibacter sp. HSC-36F09]